MEKTMSKENNTTQQDLYQPIGADIASRASGIEAGFIPNGTDQVEADSKYNTLFGDFGIKVVTISRPSGDQLNDPEQIAVAGGSCLLRSCDQDLLSQEGAVIDPVTGLYQPVTSVRQYCDWLESSIAMDQVVDSVGAVKGRESVIIAETRLWIGRIVDKLSQIFGRELTSPELEQVTTTVIETEQRRFSMSKNYLQYVLGDEYPVNQVLDRDIWEELGDVRDEMIAAAGTSIEQLSNAFAVPTASIDGLTRILGMYTGPYFDALRANGYISSEAEVALIAEEAPHAQTGSRLEIAVINNTIRAGWGYFDPEGENATTGFCAFVESVSGDGNSSRSSQNVSNVPNTSNWELCFEDTSQSSAPVAGSLVPENNRTLTLCDNALYIAALNYLPFGETLEAAVGLRELADRFKTEKKKRTNPELGRQNQEIVAALREELLEEVEILNARISDNLFCLFSTIA